MGERVHSSRVYVVAALAAGVLLVAPGEAEAATFTLKPVADSYVSSASPTAKNGSSTQLRVDGSPTINAYLRFDVRGLTEPVRQATLRLRSHSTTGSGVRVHGVSDNLWGETTITYENAPAMGPVAGSSGGFSSGTWASVDATPLVTGDGLLSVAVTTTSTSSKTFSSREVAAEAPELVVETGVRQSPPLPPPPPGDPVVAAGGDIACSPTDTYFGGGVGTATRCRQRYTSDLLLGGDLAAVLPLGDNQYERGELANFQGSYDPTWGRAKAMSRPVPGNHEYSTAGATGYFDYFNGAGQLDGPAGPRGRGYYSFDLGSWHLIALNSTCEAVGGCGAGSPQEQWLRADLAASSASCTLAYWHHPRFTSDTRGDNAAVSGLWRALHEAGAEVVLSGHNHSYERFGRQDPDGAPDPTRGIREFVVGTGGKSLAKFGLVARNSAVRNHDTFGVLKLTLRPSGYSWRFVPEGGRSFTDSGSDACDGSTPDTQAPSAPTGLVAKVSASRDVALSWTASTDNEGVAEYRIFRDGTQVGTSTRPAFTDPATSSGGNRAYRVFAVDAAGNVSGVSNTANAIVPAPGELLFSPTDDAYVAFDAPSSSYGSATTVHVDRTPMKHGLLKFNVSGVGQRRVVSAKLRLHATDGSPSGGEVRPTADATWSEGTVNWSNAPAANATRIAAFGAVAGGTWYEVDVTPAVTGDGVVSLRMTPVSSDGAQYRSKEGPAGLAPQLAIVAE